MLFRSRLSRARRRLQDIPLRTDGLTGSQISSRLPAVRQILYLLFTEGYLSCRAETAIRRELCSEAIRLATLLAAHPLGAAPETFALLALMHLHAARMTARQDASGGLVLLEEQDRDLWDQRGIELGMTWLAKSARGEVFSRYHAEAGVAAEHFAACGFCQPGHPELDSALIPELSVLLLQQDQAARRILSGGHPRRVHVHQGH